MTRLSTYKDTYWDFYELHAMEKHAVTSAEAAANAIEIENVEAHAVAVADIEYTRAYIDGVLTDVVSVAYTAAVVGPPAEAEKTTVTFSSLTEGETVDIYFPVTGTGCGSLSTNTDTGKLTRPRKQVARAWNVEEITVPLLEGGSEREVDLEVDVDGVAMLQLHHKGNTAMADFEAARAGASNGDMIYLLIDVVNTTESTTKHILLHQAQVVSCGKTSAAEESISGILTDTIALTFEPDAIPL